MSIINYAAKVINFKLVYYGPGMAGKTANLQYVHRCLPDDNRGNMISLATGDDRTLFFDFLPVSATSVRGFTTKFQLYTVPGQSRYNMTRKLVLRGVDGVVFVADSQWDRLKENVESLRNLNDNLREYRLDGLHELPRRIHAQLHGHAGAGAEGLVDEVDVERVLARQIVRVVVGDVGLANIEPLRAALSATLDLHLVSDHRAHG